MALNNQTFATLVLSAILATVPSSLLLFRGGNAIAQVPSSTPAVQTLLAQAPGVFALPQSIPDGTSVKVDGDASMAIVNQALQRAYQGTFNNGQVTLAASGSEAALQKLLEGTIDLAAIGRPLSEAEKAQGLTPVVLERGKIAVFVGADNPFSGDIGFAPFAQIFRGEISDWSQVGGPAGAIRLVDRPASSNTRQSLSTYPVFQDKPFQAGGNVQAIAEDNTAEVIKNLGNDGLGYGLYSQVKDLPGIKIIPMHKVLPDNPAYPYSQPRVYVYRGEPSVAVQSFLGVATAPVGETAIAEATAAEAAAVAAGEAPTGDAALQKLAESQGDGTTPDAANGTGAETAATATPGTTPGATAPGAIADTPAATPDATPNEGSAASPQAGSPTAGDAAAGADGAQLRQTDPNAATPAENSGRKGLPWRNILPLAALAAGGALLWWLAAADDDDEPMDPAQTVEGSRLDGGGRLDAPPETSPDAIAEARGDAANASSAIAQRPTAGADMAAPDLSGASNLSAGVDPSAVGLGAAAGLGAVGLGSAAAASTEAASTEAASTEAASAAAASAAAGLGGTTGLGLGSTAVESLESASDTAATPFMGDGAVGSAGTTALDGSVSPNDAPPMPALGAIGAVAAGTVAAAAGGAFLGGTGAEPPEPAIESTLVENRLFYPSEEFSRQAHVKSQDDYHRLYVQAKADPEGFWADLAESELHWFKKWDKTLQWTPPEAQWFVGGKLNITYNCLDRHLETDRRNKPALLWEGEPGDARVLTYAQLHREVCLFANALKKLGIGKGDVVGIYLPMIAEAAIAMLACARIGAPHSVVFGGFSAEALRDRLNDGGAKLVVTADGGWRKDKIVELKPQVDAALANNAVPTVQNVLVVQRTRQPIAMEAGRDHWWHDIRQTVSPSCPAEPMDSEDVLFILYTSGSTGKPKGVVHTTGGYNLYTHVTTKWIFDLREDDVYWCTADVGWITGHSYIVYGPLSNGATTLMYEGAPRPSNPGCFWDVVQKYKVSIFYTAPTAIRAFIQAGEDLPKARDLSSLRLLGTVGEPINPEAWMWYHRVIGGERCPIVDTWWQTETGGIMITALPGAVPTKPGSVARPFPGIVADVVDREGNPVENNQGGYLIIRHPWPSMIRTIHGDPDRFRKTYWEQIPGQTVYFAGDGARMDGDGYFWVMGRVDDVISVSGHRLGTMEIESALVSHPAVAEAAVVGKPDGIKGEAVYAFVTLERGQAETETLVQSIKDHVVQEIGALARPGEIRFTEALPKTRSGKIMRRLLRKVAAGEEISGDTSTLEDRSVLDKLRGED